MNLLLRAAIAAASFASISPAHAAGANSGIVNALPAVIAKAPAGNHQSLGTGYVVRAYVTESQRGTWLFAPRDGGGANS